MVILKRADERGNRVAMCDPSRVKVERGGGGYVKPETVLMGAGIVGKTVGIGTVDGAAEESKPKKSVAGVESEPELESMDPPEMLSGSERESLPVPQEGCVVEKEPDVQDPPWGIPVNYFEFKKRECEGAEGAVAHSSGETERESRRERRRKRKHRHGI